MSSWTASRPEGLQEEQESQASLLKALEARLLKARVRVRVRVRGGVGVGVRVFTEATLVSIRAALPESFVDFEC